MDWLRRGMELPSIRIKALAKTFSHQLWPLLAALARAIIEASGFCSGFKSDGRQFHSPSEPVHIDIIIICMKFEGSNQTRSISAVPALAQSRSAGTPNLVRRI